MKLKKFVFGLMTAAALMVSAVGGAFAQTPIFAETWVSGTVYGGDGNPVNGGSVFVQCNGFSRNTGINGDGMYAVSFPQTECKSGHTVTASASTGEGSGSSAETVQNTAVNGPTVDLDIAVVDISVPEFGTVIGSITGVGAVGAYMMMKQKGLV